jgi:3-dehydroquinate dehydratase-1
MLTIDINGLSIGSGIPKLFVSVCGENEKALVRDMEYDVLEWRADLFAETKELSELKELSEKLKKPILFTYRTKNEGGAGDITLNDYISLNRRAADTASIALIDLEYITLGERFEETADYMRKRGVKLIASSHDFNKTPQKNELIEQLRFLQAAGDMAKIAVMPKDNKDVLTMIEALLEFKESFAEKPFIGISMSKIGFITRLAAEYLGSAAVYAAAGAPAAPGQACAHDMKHMLSLAHKYL